MQGVYPPCFRTSGTFGLPARLLFQLIRIDDGICGIRTRRAALCFRSPLIPHHLFSGGTEQFITAASGPFGRAARARLQPNAKTW